LMLVGVLINYLIPDEAFEYITSVSTVGIMLVWMVILACHFRYRQAVRRGLLPAVDYRLRGFPLTSAAAMGVLLLVGVLLLFTDSGRASVAVGAAWAVLISAGYFVRRTWTARRAAKDAGTHSVR
jgi:AAT family amino acid transporter